MSNETQQKQGFEIHPPGWRQADDAQEQWNRVHAQLLKSVADAQCKLLAAQNETNDRLEGLVQRFTTLTVSVAALNANHAGLKVLLEGAQRDIVLRLEASVRGLNGRLDAIGSLLADLLQVKSYRTQPKSKRKRHG